MPYMSRRIEWDGCLRTPSIVRWQTQLPAAVRPPEQRRFRGVVDDLAQDILGMFVAGLGKCPIDRKCRATSGVGEASGLLGGRKCHRPGGSGSFCTLFEGIGP